jgi:hypothetical protein
MKNIGEKNKNSIYDLGIKNLEVVTPSKCGSDFFSSQLLNPNIISGKDTSHYHTTRIIQNIGEKNKNSIYDLGIKNLEVVTPSKCGSDFFSSKLLDPNIISGKDTSHYHTTRIIQNIGEKNKNSIYDLGIKNLEVVTPSKCGSDFFSSKLLNPNIISGNHCNHHHSTRMIQNILLNTSNNFIIVGMRNPIKQSISFFFHPGLQKFNDVIFINKKYPTAKLDYYEMMDQKFRDSIKKQNTDELTNIYLDGDFHTNTIDWISELFMITNIDKNKFDKERGFTIYPLENNNYLLLYTMEKLNDNIDFFNQFFKKEFVHSHETKNYYENDIYNKFKKELKLSNEFKNQLLDNDVVKYFYSDEDIKGFYNDF